MYMNSVISKVLEEMSKEQQLAILLVQNNLSRLQKRR